MSNERNEEVPGHIWRNARARRTWSSITTPGDSARAPAGTLTTITRGKAR